MSKSSIPVYFIWVKYISWISYANEILIINQWKDIEDIPCNKNGTKCFTNGLEVIQQLSMNVVNIQKITNFPAYFNYLYAIFLIKDNFALDFILLGVLIASFRTLACLFLFLKAYLKK